MGQPVVHCEIIVEAPESLGGRRVMGPEQIVDIVELGQFADPEGHLVGVVKADSRET